MNRKLIAAIGLMLAFCIGIFFYAEWQKQKFDASLPEPPTPTEVQAVETTEAGHTEAGHWHDGEWHAETEHVRTNVPNQAAPSAEEIEQSLTALEKLNAEWAALSPEEQAARYQAALKQAGLKPPPPGHYYYQEANGDYRLVKRGEPIFSIDYITGFAPSPGQLAKYLQLEQELFNAYAQDAHDEAALIQAEIDNLRASAQGEIPRVSALVTGEFNSDELNRAAQRQVNEAYRELGLGHMVDAGVSGLSLLQPSHKENINDY